MSHRVVASGLALVSILIVVAVVIWETSTMVSPGPLHPSHASVASLKGSRSCKECHNDTSGSFADACTACHDGIQNQHTAGAGLHGGLDAALFNDCSRCHVEHVDGAVELVSAQAFALAGVPDVESYDHHHIDSFELNGAHKSLSCERCHTFAQAVFLREGDTRFLGLMQECATCHDDPHAGELPNCAECHGQEQPFPEAPLFDHSIFPLVDGHAIADCRACHEDSEYAQASPECSSCHTDNYERTTNPAHAFIGFGTSCSECHSIVAWNDTSFEHPESFPLVDSHANLDCSQCHFAEENDLDRLAEATCALCHDSPHSDGFVSGITAAQGIESEDATCQRCHAVQDSTFALPDARMSMADHSATGFELIEPHAIEDCASCHGEYHEESEWNLAYPGRDADDCRACHEDPHDDQFSASEFHQKCLDCHNPMWFEPPNFDVDMHEQSSFALTGAHRAIACQACHERDDGSMVFIPTPTGCSDCHDDVHDGRFEKPALPVQFVGEQDCSRCHVTASFDQVAWTAREHEIWTGYPLRGAHADAACTGCHDVDEAKKGTEQYSIPSQTCADCHADPHAGQLEILGRTDCSRCHVESSFSDLVFDHSEDSRFVLDEHHNQLECSACHKAYETPVGPIIRYRPLGTECADCHGEQGESGETRFSIP
ncbi:MAG TPA: hypothetical protein ENJ00_00200 [Phycisphaerales bacterium]|nr:hypothetical protein [Phycisphaerales bacterium]